MRQAGLLSKYVQYCVCLSKSQSGFQLAGGASSCQERSLWAVGLHCLEDSVTSAQNRKIFDPFS